LLPVSLFFTLLVRGLSLSNFKSRKFTAIRRASSSPIKLPPLSILTFVALAVSLHFATIRHASIKIISDRLRRAMFAPRGGIVTHA
jgi:hypothetical protein